MAAKPIMESSRGSFYGPGHVPMDETEDGITLRRGQPFPEGTLVEAYNAADVAPDPLSGLQGPVADAQVVKDGELTFTGLTPSWYAAQAKVGGKWIFVKFPFGKPPEGFVRLDRDRFDVDRFRNAADG